jgi:very-short-patch-repair endonuclease
VRALTAGAAAPAEGRCAQHPRCVEIAIATRQQLARHGWRRGDLERELARGGIIRIRQGYFARPEAPRELVEAVRQGGVATGATALRQHGLWAPEDSRLHVAVAPNAARLPPRDIGAVRHWHSSFEPVVRTGLDFRPIASVAAAVEHAVREIGPHEAVAVLDSALHAHRLTAAALAMVLDGIPAAARRHIDGRTDARAESGVESIARVLLQDAGIAAAVQVVIVGIGRVDLLIDGWLIVEIDGSQHADPAQMRKDRARDAAAIRLGYRTIRLTYADVVHRWPQALATIRAALADGAPVGARTAFARRS